MRRLIGSMDKTLLTLSITMLIIGLIMIFSASNVMATTLEGNTYLYLFKQGSFLLAGIIMAIVIIQTPTRNYYKISLMALVVLIIMLFGLDIFGSATRSSKSWIPVGPINIQPSEFCKMAIIMFMATYYERIINRNRNDMKSVAIPLLVGGICVALTAIQPDFGTALVLISLIVVIFISLPLDGAIKRRIYKIGGILFLSIIFLGAMLLFSKDNFLSNKIDRFNFFEPCTRYQDNTGYQVCNGYIAINNGGLTGVGLGKSTQKYLYLPEAHTDFIFPIIVEELGLIGGSIILMFFFFILYRIIRIARRSISLRGSILAYGVATYMFLHIAINLTGVLGLLPLTGLPLPFLSYGGSNLWTLIIGLSIVQRVEIERNEQIRKNILKKSII